MDIVSCEVAKMIQAHPGIIHWYLWAPSSSIEEVTAIFCSGQKSQSYNHCDEQKVKWSLVCFQGKRKRCRGVSGSLAPRIPVEMALPMKGALNESLNEHVSAQAATIMVSLQGSATSVENKSLKVFTH